MSAPAESWRAGQRAAVAANRARTAERIEDLEFLLSQGVPAEQAFARIGWSAAAGARACRRWGRADLACAAEQIARLERRARAAA